MGFFGGGGGTTVSNMVGATSSTTGTAGLVPAPAAGQELFSLRGDATFANSTYRQLDFTNATQKGYFILPLSAFISGAAPTANLLYLLPVYLPSYTYTTIRAPRHSGTSGSATTIRMGLYNCNQKTYEPTTRVFETAETNHFSSTSNLDVTISQALSAGVYYTAIVFSNLSGSTFATLIASRSQSQILSPYITFPSDSANMFLPGLTYSHTGASVSLPSDLSGSTFSFTTSNINFPILKV